MSIIYNPNYLDYPSQTQKNKDDIENLQKYVKNAYNTNETLLRETTKIEIEKTSIPKNAKDGYLIDVNANLFNIVTVLDGIVYLNFWCSLKGEQGEQGVKGGRGQQGPIGPQGIQGIQGEQGVQGIQGIQGEQGIKGDKGENGNSFTISFSVDSVSDLPPLALHSAGYAGFVGTSYPRHVYIIVKDKNGDNIWSNQGPIEGPIGPQGIQGIQGKQGIQGIQGKQGIQGEQGEKGDGFNFLGTWINDNEYYKNDVVGYEVDGAKNEYILISDSLLGSSIPPNQDTTNWQLFVSGASSKKLYCHHLEVSTSISKFFIVCEIINDYSEQITKDTFIGFMSPLVMCSGYIKSNDSIYGIVHHIVPSSATEFEFFYYNLSTNSGTNYSTVSKDSITVSDNVVRVL